MNYSYRNWPVLGQLSILWGFSGWKPVIKVRIGMFPLWLEWFVMTYASAEVVHVRRGARDAGYIMGVPSALLRLRDVAAIMSLQSSVMEADRITGEGYAISDLRVNLPRMLEAQEWAQSLLAPPTTWARRATDSIEIQRNQILQGIYVVGPPTPELSPFAKWCSVAETLGISTAGVEMVAFSIEVDATGTPYIKMDSLLVSKRESSSADRPKTMTYAKYWTRFNSRKFDPERRNTLGKPNTADVAMTDIIKSNSLVDLVEGLPPQITEQEAEAFIADLPTPPQFSPQELMARVNHNRQVVHQLTIRNRLGIPDSNENHDVQVIPWPHADSHTLTPSAHPMIPRPAPLQPGSNLPGLGRSEELAP